MKKAHPKAPSASDDTMAMKGKYALDEQPGFLLRVALKAHRGFFAAKMIEGLTAPQFSTLAKLSAVGPCSQNYLGRLIHYDSATITGVINRLEVRGLIERVADPSDRRRIAVGLTEQGREVANAAIRAVGEASTQTFAQLTSAERTTLAALLTKVILR